MVDILRIILRRAIEAALSIEQGRYLALAPWLP